MKKITKILALVVAVALFALCFAGCTTPQKDTLICGVTIYEDFNEKDAEGNWIGFECDFARAVGEIIGMNVEFQEIDWGKKYDELNSGAITCIWNAFTANSTDKVTLPGSSTPVEIKRSELVDFTYGYMLNQQCIVVKASEVDNYRTTADLAGKTACAEQGSAGYSTAAEYTDEDNISTTPAQINAFTEVKSGAVQFIVVDILLAQRLCGQGDFADLAIAEDIVLDSEIYAIGFKKDSPLTAKVNAAIKQLEENGKLMEIATRWGLENVLQVSETIE